MTPIEAITFVTVAGYVLLLVIEFIVNRIRRAK